MGNLSSLFICAGIRYLALYQFCVKKDVDQEGIGVLDDMTIPAVD